MLLFCGNFAVIFVFLGILGVILGALVIFLGGIDAFFVIFAKGFGSLWVKIFEYGGFAGRITEFLVFWGKKYGFWLGFWLNSLSKNGSHRILGGFLAHIFACACLASAIL